MLCYQTYFLTLLNPHSVISFLVLMKWKETLPVGKASGPNAISYRILRELSSELSTPLCSLFNHSLHTECVPISYKEANVTPVPKKGDLSIVSNYRPISLLNSEDKVSERLVLKHLYNHLHRHNLISSLQSSFMPGDSTVNQFAYLYNTFCQTLDVGKEVRVVFGDISKAFDRVWHSGLLLKLQAAGVTGEVLAWFKSYLSNRKQRVVLPGAVSDWVFIQAGVPQGSILGPLLFLLYMTLYMTLDLIFVYLQMILVSSSLLKMPSQQLHVLIMILIKFLSGQPSGWLLSILLKPNRY